MPLYSYTCRRCGPFEVRHGMENGPLARCPKCGIPDPTRVFSVPNVIIK